MTPTKPQAATPARVRKPWRKKTAAEIVLAQADILRREIADGEQELAHKRAQLKKFEQVKQIFEGS